MSDDSAIEWTDCTWNPVLGCSKVSAGCASCYAIRSAYRSAHMPHTAALYRGLTERRADGSLNWTGNVRLIPERLHLPLRWRKPRRVFVNSLSDLWHEDVPDEFIDRVFGVMALAHWHTFQVLTKRPKRMVEWFQERWQPAVAIGATAWEDRSDKVWDAAYSEIIKFPRGNDARFWDENGCIPGFGVWPLPNVWLGVSVENQQAADERIPLLLQTPAAVRFLSCEPLLATVDLRAIPDPIEPDDWRFDALAGGWYLLPSEDRYPAVTGNGPEMGGTISWVVAGGESGPGFRPLNLDWARSLRDQCQAAGVPFLFKQVGGRTPKAGGRMLDGRTWDEYPSGVTHA